jgi:hypothetical protein
MISKINLISNYYNINDDIINNIKDLLYGTILDNKQKYKNIMKSINEKTNIQLFYRRLILDLLDIKKLKNIKIKKKEFDKTIGNNILIFLEWEKNFNGPSTIMINDFGYLHIETYEYTAFMERDILIVELIDIIIYSSINNFIDDIKQSNTI